eukprot:5130374-Pyramimonas_sp.AAC.1
MEGDARDGLSRLTCSWRARYFSGSARRMTLVSTVHSGCESMSRWQTARHSGHEFWRSNAVVRQERQKACPQGVTIGAYRRSKQTVHWSSDSMSSLD